MKSTTKCPVCLNAHGANATRIGDLATEKWLYECTTCGRYLLHRDTIDDYLDSQSVHFTPVVRAALSHELQKKRKQPIEVSSDWMEAIRRGGLRLPTPAERAVNTIRLIGDEVATTGNPITELPVSFYAAIGAPNPSQAHALLEQLIDNSLIFARVMKSLDGARFADLDLTLSGWERYESERRGGVRGDYGFVALKFGDATLDGILRNHVRPGLQSQLSYDLVDMRDAARAGIIDSIMREKIRDSAFVIADLTHDNCGAYWEAGYAEGLGKPVVYICEESKFTEQSTHFDTNHLTTVLWSQAAPENFVEQLVATLRRSLR